MRQPKLAVTVRSRSSADCWKTMPRRDSAANGVEAISLPKMAAAPASALNKPVSIWKSVVLPAPFGPSNATNSPSATDRLMPSTALRTPNDLLNCRTSSGCDTRFFPKRIMPQPLHPMTSHCTIGNCFENTRAKFFFAPQDGALLDARYFTTRQRLIAQELPEHLSQMKSWSFIVKLTMPSSVQQTAEHRDTKAASVCWPCRLRALQLFSSSLISAV